MSSNASRATLSSLFSRLSLAVSSNDYDQVLQIANDVLKSSPNDTRAARQKIIALIKLDKYKDALSYLEESEFLKAEDTILERGFCLYKLGRGEEAQKVLEAGSGRALDHIRAQNAYRMEDFAAAVRLYENLRKGRGQIDNEAEDIASNLSAAKAQGAALTGIGDDKFRESVDSYEVKFNQACEYVALGRLDEAEAALNKAEKLCGRAGLSEEELKVEQGIILTQLAYVKQLQGDTEAASKLYNDILNQESVDASTRAIALNNQLVIEPRDNPFENYRIHSTASQAIASSKPFSVQSRLFTFNSLLLASQAHKPKTSSSIKKHLQSHPSDYSPSIIRVEGELPNPSDPMFISRLTSAYYHDEKDVGAALLLIQHHLGKGNIHIATTVLEKLFHALKDIPDTKYAPGLVSLAVLLYPKDDREDKATSLLLEAKRHWTSKGKMDASTAALGNHATLARLTTLLFLPSSQAHSQELETMIKEQKVYLKDHPNDIATHAVLAALYSATSSNSGSRHTSVLPSISSLTSSVKVSELEAQGIPTAVTNVAQKRKVTKTKSRKRKARGGKEYDPSKEVDPERWLPLRERSYYKPVKSKKRRTGGATQGGATTEGESMLTAGGVPIEIKKTDPKKKKKGRR